MRRIMLSIALPLRATAHPPHATPMEQELSQACSPQSKVFRGIPIWGILPSGNDSLRKRGFQESFGGKEIPAETIRIQIRIFVVHTYYLHRGGKTCSEVRCA